MAIGHNVERSSNFSETKRSMFYITHYYKDGHYMSTNTVSLRGLFCIDLHWAPTNHIPKKAARRPTLSPSRFNLPFSISCLKIMDDEELLLWCIIEEQCCGKNTKPAEWALSKQSRFQKRKNVLTPSTSLSHWKKLALTRAARNLVLAIAIISWRFS